MGVNASRSISNVTNKIEQSLVQNAGARANANCRVGIGAINFRNNRGCQLINENRCGASASASLDAIAKAAAQAYNEASIQQRTELLPGFNINSTVQETENEIRRRLNAKCESDAEVANEISLGNIDIDNCENSVIRNTNAGTAESNCGIRTIMNDIVEAQASLETKQTTGVVNLANILGFGNLGQGGSLISVISCFSIICIFLIIILVIGYKFIESGGVEQVTSASTGVPL